MADSSINVAGATFENPITTPAGAPTINVHGIKACIEAGARGCLYQKSQLSAFHKRLPCPANLFLDKFGDPGAIMTLELGFWRPKRREAFVKEVKPVAEGKNAKVIANIDESAVT